MKIAYYSYDNVNNPKCGGGGAYRDLLIHRFLAKKHDIVFYTGNYIGKKLKNDNGITCNYLGLKTSYLISRITFSILATIHSLFVNADVVVICYSVFSPVISFLLRKKRTIIELFHLTGKNPFEKYSVFGVFPWLAEHSVLLFGRNFITLSDSLAALIKERYKSKEVCAAYTGFDTDIITGKKGKDEKYVLYFGRIDIHMKGIDILLDAFEKITEAFPAYTLKIAGRGTKKDVLWLKKRIKSSSNAERIEFFENVSRDHKINLFHNATFLCMPSRFEGWCISAIEAAACSKATLGTRIMGLQDSIKHNETGVLVNPEDSDDLADKMKMLLSDKKLRDRLGKNGYAWAQNFTWERVSKIHEDFYRKINSQR
jgi:glycosyltransferase involved in cell wall biosynthesis